MKIVRRATFNAAHRLFKKEWSDIKNEEVFGLCSNPNYHGHNYCIEVGITGPINPETGFVIDLKMVKEIISNEIIERFDHRNLNLDCPEFKELIPTVENIAQVCFALLRPHFPKENELSIRLFETENNWAEYNGEQ